MSDRSRTTPRAAAVMASGLAMVGILAFGTNAAAEGELPPTEPAPETTAAEPVVASSSSVSLMLFGAPLMVDINLDPGGNLVDVTLNPTVGFTATTVKPNNVVFVNEGEGVSVKVKAKHGGEKIEARAADLGDVSGTNTWSGDVFENDQETVVKFTVGARADGSPDITSVTVAPSDGATVGETEYKTDDDHDGERASASVVIRFADSGQSRTLRITVSLRTGDDHTSAKLRIGLSRIKGAEVPDGDAVDSHTWSGMLCDGTSATIAYTVAADGSITDVSATPEGAEINSGDHGTKVRFATGESVRIKVRDNDGVLQVGVKDRIHCDAAAPSVGETPIDPDADTGDDDDHDGDRRGGGGRGDDGDDGGRGHHRHDRGGDD